jgi:hypothetical protein
MSDNFKQEDVFSNKKEATLVAFLSVNTNLALYEK